jgi:GMP synthase-like glutamine amidotransferase
VRALAIVHQRDAGAGVFADAADDRGVELDTWLRAETDSPPADPAGYDAVLTFGGAMHADHEGRHPWLRDEKRMLAELLEREVPLLGVCLGSQLLAEAAGGAAQRASEPEIGWFEVEVVDDGNDDPLLGPLAPAFEAFEWHSYEVELPDTATVLARTPACIQAYRLGASAWGIQFHAEVSAADAEKWIGEYDTDKDAVRVGVDPEALRRETRERIEAWNGLGRDLCGRFLDAVG